MALTAMAAFLIFVLAAFGLRSLVHYRRTGASGFVGLSGRVGSAEWCGGALFILALIAGGLAPVAQMLGWVEPALALDAAVYQTLGILLFAAGFAVTLWAQFAMGDSWRIGVDESERTALVAHGPFLWVRNPIFSGMVAATVGLALLVPNAVAAVAVAALLVGLELHVRFVEEPYLLRTHGESYRAYAARTGRFLPGIGLSKS